MGRITRHPQKPGPKHGHAVDVAEWGHVDEWIWPEAERVAGVMGYQVKKRGWASTRILFDTIEKAREFADRLERHRHDVEIVEARRRPCPIRTRYDQAALGLHAVTWGLSTGVIRDVVQAYRRTRRDCSSHGVANSAAAKVIIERCPHLDTYAGRERARDMAEHMLVYVEVRHRDWFWRGLEGDHHLYAFQFHR
ncbi:MAG TPA: hypothetical protein VMI56_17185 [Reyranella sp.]|nr:hypothetical protein [Reyranella sp.]